MINFAQEIDRKVVADIEKFWIKLDERVLYTMGVRETYDTGGDAALGNDVEYFHFSICADARMRYLGENVVLIDPAILSDRNKICNAAIAHLYGGRRIHTIFSGISDPKRAHLDFERIDRGDQAYMRAIVDNAVYARSHGFKFYGTTELHTSLQTAARNFCREKYGDPTRPATNTDIVEWIASWISSGLVDDLIQRTPTLAEAYRRITGLPGVGAYYGYHFGVDCSLFHMTPYRHDERFCVPGPGCQETLNLLFPKVGKKLPYGDAVIWICENQKELFPNLKFNKALWNIEANGKKMFPFEQDKLMVYGSEVGLCQHSIYRRLSQNPHLIEKRKVGVDPDITPIRLREEGTPVTPEEWQLIKSGKTAQTRNLVEF